MTQFKAEMSDRASFLFEGSPHKDSRWNAPDEQALLLETSKRLFINETSELAEFAGLMSDDARAHTIDELAQISEHVLRLIREINRQKG